ncbi:MAG: crossover junction endodeoxyribonuclease RuvC [bacterium]|nr:crossover junction endodeoxyribonuclease RuvC [bacterium]
MVILGLDPGTARLGYGIIESDGRHDRCVTYGVLTTPVGPLGPRLVVLRAGLQQLIATHHPNRIVVEQLFFSKNVKTAMAVGEARGVILLTCTESGVDTVEVSPQQVKQAVSGFGAADKGQVQRMIQALLHLPDIPQPDDAADALAIAWCGGRILNDATTRARRI